VYGIGQLVLHAPAMISPVLPDVLAGIVAVMRAEDARDPENNTATENAIATLGWFLARLSFVVPPVRLVETHSVFGIPQVRF
jgi:hypothetical protein